MGKVLANGLAKVVSYVISESQSTFMGNKQILDSILVLNEDVDFMKKEK